VEVVHAIRIRLDKLSTWYSLEKSYCSPLKVAEVFLSPADPSAGILELVSHSKIEGMKSTPKTSGEYRAFESLLKQVIQVPHSEIKEKLEAEKRTKKEKRLKISDASRASGDKD
jgi:hypothetical protein